EWPDGRNKRLSPITEKITELGAQFGVSNGWERANWFAQSGDDTSDEATHTWEREGPWHERVREECLAVRDAVGVLDLPGFSRYRIKGEGARQWLSKLITGNVPKPGRMGLGYFADERGRIVTEMSIMALDENFFFLITAAAAEWHDLELLRNNLPENSSIEIINESENFSCQIVCGPNSRPLLADICDADLSLPWLSHQTTMIANKHCQLVRVCFGGELGWEIHSMIADTGEIYDAVWQAGKSHGLKPFGMFALDSLRLEKGYRAWKGDLSTDYTILQGGLERFINWDKSEFRGKAALEKEKAQGISKRFVTLIVEAEKCDAPYMSTLWHDGEVVGETTSGGWGHRIDKSIALGMVRAELANENTELEVEIYGKMYPAIVQHDKPLWDPQNKRLRS
ncbi:MAG: aminomethyltransferase family protein, partial [Rhizobiaceae bacterium]|nr:aminomethyltransferase family protein [Rhizobiaceae bacterium]